ncbi:hypothetical protein ACFSX5_00690 [Devosia albogilva]|uniref:Uncharacterized protein n=1 Tax=Devosia albogilva TaxID=429726 RepID=A0ABW5QF89_9HYPH
MPHLSRRHLLSTLVTGFTAILAVAFACLYATHHGGPAWLQGQELAIFIKLALVTVTLMAIDICWKARTA